VPWHFGNWHFGGAQERKGSVDTCIISKNNEQAIFSVADKTTEYGLTHIMYLIYSDCCQYFWYLRYPINASSSKYLFCARSIREKNRAFKSSMQYKQIRIAQESLRKKQGAMRRAKMMKFKQYY